MSSAAGTLPGPVVPWSGRLSQSHLGAWLLVFLFLAACFFLRERFPWIAAFPESLLLPIGDAINWAMDGLVAVAKPFFRGITWLLDHPMTWVRSFLQWMPWPAFMLLAGAIAYRAGGWRLAAFTIASLAYMLVIGYWAESMNTLALVAISVPMAVAIGFGFGVAGFASRRAEQVILPALDVLQTVPAFAYLLPILVLFGFGPVVGLIASVLYSFAPMVRNTIIGLRSVAPDIVESGLMSGTTRQQLFWQVRVPTALRQLLLGVNQSTMASLSMVIVASIIGGTNDIGWEVLSTMRKAQFGESLLAGIVIALMAMILDRITWGLATREPSETRPGSWFETYRYWIVATLGTIVLASVFRLAPTLMSVSEAWVISPADALNDFITWFVVSFEPAIKEIKRVSLFYVMLPLRIGLEQTVTPFSWGFTWSSVHTVFYFGLALAASLYLLRRFGVAAAVSTGIICSVYYAGLTTIPWPGLVAVLAMMAYALGGWRLTAGTVAGLAFLLLSGAWEKAMLSLYLCGIAVILSFGVGSILGIWAAHSQQVSRIMRPVNDTLQTMPLFVILIPVVMVFKIGEFTALLAIMAYAYVPAFRYAEHGMRTVPEEVVEAARSMGCSKWQLLWQVKLPLSIPNIMLGLNQTIMYAIAMLVIAALVGTNGLGQQVYIGLSKGDVGIGLVAGVGMALIAIIADRMCQAAKRNFEARVSV